MKTLLAAIFFLGSVYSGTAQQQHFVYIQTDNKQPFFVRVNDQVYSSSASGYVVIPKLVKAEYSFTIGFPKNEWPLQNVLVKVDEDEGYLLKNFQEKGWGLYNIQTMSVLMAANNKEAPATPVQTKTDAFSNVLADVVNTPSLKEEVVKAQPKEIKAETKINTPVPVIEPVQQNPEINAISKLSSGKDSGGNYAVYLDAVTGDTVKVFFPAAGQETIVNAENITAPVKEPVKDSSIQVKPSVTLQEKQEPRVAAEKDKRFLDIEVSNPNSNSDSSGTGVRTISTEKATPAPVKKGLSINSDCKAVATDSDFLKARKKMAAEDNNEDMVDAARKLFKSKCYSTEQIRNLAVLFLNDEGKYKFFDAAYPFVHDTQNFSLLQSELKEEYYISRFRAMVRQ